MNYPKITIGTLILLMFLLSLMVPGGPIETRSFANIDPAIVFGFNVFLTLLVIVSIVTVYFMFKKQRWAYQLGGILGFSYILVFILDLAKIFPVSPDPMGTSLLVLEWVSLMLGTILIGTSYKTLSATEAAFWSGRFKIPLLLIISLVLLMLVGVYIVYFATSSALN
jgi:hypothetical protein